MGKLKFTFSNIFFWLGLIASCLMFENVSFLSSNTKGLSDTHFYLLFAFIAICYITYYVLDFVFNRSQVDFVLLAVLLIGLASGLVGIWSIQDFTLTGVNTFNFTINSWEKIRQSLSLVTFVSTVYAILFVFNKNYPSMKKVMVIYAVVIMLCYVSIIYSLITEMDKYVDDLSLTRISPAAITSFYWNGNMYCGMLILGILSSIGLNYFKKNALSYVSIIIFLAMIVMVGSLTSILVAVCLVPIYFLLEIIFTIKKDFKRGIARLFIYLSVILSLVILFAISLNFNLGQFSNFCKYLYMNFETARYSTLSFRTFTWGSITNYMGANPLQLIFGAGYVNSDRIVAGFWHAYSGENITFFSAHSGYYQILMNFGVIGLLIYALFVVYYIYCFVKLLKTDTRFAFLFLLIGIAIFAYAVMESVIMFNPNALGILVGTAFFLPMINKYKHLKHTSLGSDVIEVEKPPLMDSNLLGKSLARIFMGLLATACAFFVFPFMREYESLRYLLINIIVALGLCLLFVPFIISSFARCRIRGLFLAISIFDVVVVFGLTIYLICRYYISKDFMAGDAK